MLSLNTLYQAKFPHYSRRNIIVSLLLTCFFASAAISINARTGAENNEPKVKVQIITDEADVVLSILAKLKSQQTVSDSDWQRVFSSEGYVRLKKREAAMQRAFEDSDFKTFVLSDGLRERHQALSDTLAKWKTVDVKRIAQRVLTYLPKNAHIQAKIYPEIKPRENSFVFDVETDPAIFLYLDPKVGKEKFENTLAHELHHIGFGTACPSQQTKAAIKNLPQNQQNLLVWLGAFGEGFAMLAAAGGPNTHPHVVSLPDERNRWDKDVAKFDSDLKLVEKFFLDILGDKLSDEERTRTAREFYGVQGPWYTVGWKMAVTIEKVFGRARLIESMCDQRQLLSTYNKAATQVNRRGKEKLALWSEAVTSKISTSHHATAQTSSTVEPDNNTSQRLQDIVKGILSAWDKYDVVCFGEDHGSKNDSDLRIALVQHPDFIRKVKTIVDAQSEKL